MKTCPVCQSRSFDDMNVCFGCMHSFESEALPDTTDTEASVIEIPTSAAADTSAPSKTGVIEDSMAMPSGYKLVISLIPEQRTQERATTVTS